MESVLKSSKPSCSLLALLPKPKNVINTLTPKNKTQSDLLTSKKVEDLTLSQIGKRKIESTNEIVDSKKQCLPIATVSSLVSYESSSDSENDEDNDSTTQNEDDKKIDFFGINSELQLPGFEIQSTLPQLEPVLSDIAIGPAKPDYLKNNYVKTNENNEFTSASLKLITDQQVSKLIYDKELAQYGGTTIMAAEAASNIIDVSVDQALGPGMRENLLKNLNNKALAQMSVGPLPKVKKDSNERLAKQKHQITHLAGLAVAREELLQEKWAENKQKKRASARRYGF